MDILISLDSFYVVYHVCDVSETCLMVGNDARMGWRSGHVDYTTNTHAGWHDETIAYVRAFHFCYDTVAEMKDSWGKKLAFFFVVMRTRLEGPDLLAPNEPNIKWYYYYDMYKLLIYLTYLWWNGVVVHKPFNDGDWMVSDDDSTKSIKIGLLPGAQIENKIFIFLNSILRHIFDNAHNWQRWFLGNEQHTFRQKTR